MDTTRTTLAGLAARGPAAARVLQRHRLDFCCGGGRSLCEARAERGIDPPLLLGEIEPRAEAEGAPPEALSTVSMSITPNLRRPRLLTADLEAPADACGTWRALYDEGRELELDLMRHVHLENNVLFPAVLTA